MLDAVLSHLRRVAPDEMAVPILQPADPFLETAGEDMRRRIFMTETVDGQLKCLRPEFTIPICLAYAGTKQARYACGGTVFRQARAGATEFEQVGLEDLGNENTADADAACVIDMLDALALAGIDAPQVTLGDQNLFGVVVENLELPRAIARRLVRNFGSDQHIAQLIENLVRGTGNGTSNGSSALAQLATDGALEPLAQQITDLMRTANLPTTAGRSPADIAARMVAKQAETDFRLSADQADILRGFLALEAPLDGVADVLENYATKAGFSFGGALDLFANRADKLAGRGLTYKASFGRKLDYYTGLLFEAEAHGIPVGGGGRYDRLCTLLGASVAVPAVGFSIPLDRVASALAKGDAA